MNISVHTAQDLIRDAVVNQDRATFARRGDRFEVRNPLVIEENKFYSENQVQWGHKPGLNSGNGQTEAAMTGDLFVALSGPEGPFRDDPDWWKDDKKFYKFLREHPELDRRPGKHSS